MNIVGRTVGALGLSAIAATALGTPATAAPLNSPQSDEPFPFTCPSGVVAVVPAPGNGDWTPGFIVGTHQVFIPYQFTFSQTGEEPATVSKGAQLPGGAITCSASETFTTEDGQTITATITVTGALRGSR